MNIKAFVLAAGLGTRLRPITLNLPKPLLPILGKPIIEYILEHLKTLNLKKIGINLHYQPEKLLGWIKNSSFDNLIQTFYEEEILGTGGALKNAQTFLKDSVFIVYNADVFTFLNLQNILRFHLTYKPIGTLVVRHIPKKNNLYINKEGKLIGIDPFFIPEKFYKKIGFTGIAIYSPEFLDFLPQGFCSVIEGWIKVLKQNKPILTYEISEDWFDIGTPSSYFKTVIFVLKLKGETAYFHPEAQTDFLDFQGYVVVETPTKFLPGSYLENVIFLASCDKFFKQAKNGILGTDFFLPIDKKLLLEPYKKEIPIGYGGSDRKIFRIFLNRSKDKSYVKMKFSSNDEDFERTILYNQFFISHTIPVPKILDIDRKKREIIFEDLGDVSLYTWLKGKKYNIIIKNMYKNVIRNLVKLHTINLEEKESFFRTFDYEYFRWETSYFKQMFLEFFCKLKKIDKNLEEEFDILARICDKFPKNVIHRDFQSQNIMIKNKEVFFIDYQGARIGPPGYDVVSLLWDPYVDLDSSVRQELISFYLEVRQKKDPHFDKVLFLKSIPFLRLQRHLQALAAYVNLSFFKGKKYFVKFIPRVLTYLKDDLENFEFKVLKKYIQIGLKRVDKTLTISYF